MRVWVLANVICVWFPPSSIQRSIDKVLDRDSAFPMEEIDPSNPIHGSDRSHLKISPMHHQPYDIQVYKVGYSDALNQYGELYDDILMTMNGYQNTYNFAEDYQKNPFSSLEKSKEEYPDKDNWDTGDLGHYKTESTMNLEDPTQLETISTQSFHKDVEPFDISDILKEHHHGDELEQAEVHYHDHKHFHKHKQDHSHKHRNHYHHKRNSHHRQSHHSRPKNGHKHQHHQEHKNSHHSLHKFGHRFPQGRNHDHHRQTQEYTNPHEHLHRHGHTNIREYEDFDKQEAF